MSEDRRQVHEGNMLLLLVIPQPQGQSDSLLVQPTLGRSATLSACWGPSIVSRIRTGLGLQDGGVTLHRLPPWDSGTLLLQLLGKTPPLGICVTYKENEEKQGEHTQLSILSVS